MTTLEVFEKMVNDGGLDARTLLGFSNPTPIIDLSNGHLMTTSFDPKAKLIGWVAIWEIYNNLFVSIMEGDNIGYCKLIKCSRWNGIQPISHSEALAIWRDAASEKRI